MELRLKPKHLRVTGLWVLRLQRSINGPCWRSASRTRSPMSSSCGSNAPGGDRNWNRSCPCCAATSALARVPRSAREMWSTVTSTPLAVPQSLAYLSNQTSYDGTKWLHWRILSDFCGRLIHTVGPSATAAAAPVVVFTNSRRSIPFCLVMGLSSIGPKRRCQVSGSWHLTPDTWHRSQRVQRTQSDLVGAGGPRVVPGRRAEPLQPERVAPRAVAHQGVADVTQLAGEGTARLLRESRRVRLVHPVKRPQAPVGIEVVPSLGPRAPAADVPLLLDVGEVLPQRLPVVEVAVQRELTRRHVEARLEPPRRHVRAGDARAGGVLPVEVADDVAAPAEVRGLFREVEERLKLRQPGSLAVADAVGDIRSGDGRPRALHRRELELDGHRLSHREVVIEKDPRVPPPDFAPGAVPHREREMRQRYRRLAEQGRPVLADPNGGAAVRQVDVGETDPHLRLLVPERRRTIEPAEEVALEHRSRCPLAEHRPRVEGEIDARVANVAVGEELVGRRLDGSRKLGVLPLSEPAEQPAIGEHGGADETTDSERLPLPELHHLLSRCGRRNPEDHGRSDSEPRERCQSRSHEIPLL